MTLVYITSLVLVTAGFGLAVWAIHRVYIYVIDGLRADNKDLRDRLFQSKALPPSGINLTEKYEARQERIREEKQDPKKPLANGPIERLEAQWKEKDLHLANTRHVDATRPNSTLNRD